MDIDAKIQEISQRHLGFDATIPNQERDPFDFHEVSKSEVHNALTEAFAAGFYAGNPDLLSNCKPVINKTSK